MIHGLAPRSTIHGLVRHLPGQHDQQSHAGGVGGGDAAVPGPIAGDPWGLHGRDSAAWDQAAPSGDVENIEDRKALKRKVADEVAARMETLISEDELLASPLGMDMRYAYGVKGETPHQTAARVLHDQWAETSGDSSDRAIAIQRAAAREFGLKGADPMYANDDGSWKPSSKPPAEPTYGALRPDLERANDRLLRAYVRAEYENTQAALKARGITELELYRGVGESGAGGGPHFTGSRTPVALRSNPLSSWGSTPFSAQSFAADSSSKSGGGPAYVFSIRVPASRVFSTAFSGAGCLPEYEAIILAGPGDQASVRRFEP